TAPSWRGLFGRPPRACSPSSSGWRYPPPRRLALEHCRRRNRPRSVSRQTPSSPRRRHSPRRRRPAHASTLARGTSSGQPGYAGRQGPSPAGARLPALLEFRDSGAALDLRVLGRTQLCPRFLDEGGGAVPDRPHPPHLVPSDRDHIVGHRRAPPSSSPVALAT